MEPAFWRDGDGWDVAPIPRVCRSGSARSRAPRLVAFASWQTRHLSRQVRPPAPTCRQVGGTDDDFSMSVVVDPSASSLRQSNLSPVRLHLSPIDGATRFSTRAFVARCHRSGRRCRRKCVSHRLFTGPPDFGGGPLTSSDIFLAKYDPRHAPVEQTLREGDPRTTSSRIRAQL
jgi:hypothetical protein